MDLGTASGAAEGDQNRRGLCESDLCFLLWLERTSTVKTVAGIATLALFVEEGHV